MNGHSAIDIHAHYFPEAYLRLIETQGSRFDAGCDFSDPRGPMISIGGAQMPPLAHKFTDIDLRVAEMDEIGVDIHALSLTVPMVSWADGEMALRLSEAFNDSTAESHAKYPDRLYGLATLPWHDPALAVRELDRVASIEGIRGVYSSTRVCSPNRAEDRELSDESLYPIFERIEDQGHTLFLHPSHVVEPARLAKYYLTNLIGNPTESAIAGAHLIFGGIMDRYPKLEVCLPHAGGSFPYLVGRFNHGAQVRAEMDHMEKDVVEYLRRFHYDTVSHSAKALSYLIDLVGTDRVVLGSDYCFDMGYEHPVEVVTEHSGIDYAAAGQILGANAKRLLGL
jgi:aminocarboxymuconate-semialdehyde decarboxylase